jgi:hypothetical protein
MRNADLLGHKLNARPLPRVSMTEIDLSDELVDLIGEYVLTPRLSLVAIVCDKDRC